MRSLSSTGTLTLVCKNDRVNGTEAPRASSAGLVRVMVLRDLNLAQGFGLVERLGVGRVVALPALEAEAWCLAGWATRLNRATTRL